MDDNFHAGLALGMLLALIILMIASNYSKEYEDAVKEDEHYCEMVKSGVWPDYKNIYKEVCE